VIEQDGAPIATLTRYGLQQWPSKAGSAKNTHHWMAPGFDAPLGKFREYKWRHPRTKVRKLVKLGVRLDMAIKHAISRKKYWRMSCTPAMRYAMPNSWLEQQGLLSLKQRWVALAPLRGTA
jgi:hypothetical protein